jgi:hypothetical protein
MLSSETWVGEFSGQGFEVDDTGPITAEIFGRSIGEDQWGLGDPLYLDATLTELSNTVDDGIDSNYYNVEVNLYYLRDASLPGGYDFDTEGKLWIGSIFHGCVIATVLFDVQLWWALKTGSCGPPGLNWYEGQCPSVYCQLANGCALAGAPKRQCVSIKIGPFCPPARCAPEEDNPSCFPI